ncbi:MAG: iron dicitrate transport regulator FecR [Burkholderiales bacterium]
MAIGSDAIDERRRQWLVRMLAAGMYATSAAGTAQPLGRVPGPLPPGRSIYDLRGRVTVDGRAADEQTAIGATSVVETGPGSSITFVVGADAFILRARSRLVLQGDSPGIASFLRVATGALLSVFGRGAKRIETPTATIGIRGTGLYLEAEPDRSYVCLCYGAIDLSANGAPDSREQIASRHHDAPRYVLGAGAGRRIVPAGFINHGDLELMLLENLVGRSTPFSLFDESYANPRRY